MKGFLKKYKYIFLSCLSVLAVLLVWYVCCDVLHLTKSAVFPGPVKCVQTFIKKLTTKAPDGATLPVHLMASLKVCLLGYGLGALVGVPLEIGRAHV